MPAFLRLKFRITQPYYPQLEENCEVRYYSVNSSLAIWAVVCLLRALWSSCLRTWQW